MGENYKESRISLAYLDKVVTSYTNDFESRAQRTHQESIIFVPTNGTGLGHMTRLVAIAKRVKELNPKVEILFFTTSYASETIKKEGFKVYYFPSRDLCDEEVVANVWNKAIEKVLSKIILYYKPKCLIFDGTFPYLGIIMGMAVFKEMKKIWIKRGNNKIEDTENIIKKEKYFDMIVEPGEAGTLISKNDRYYYSNPIICLEENELLKRSKVRRILQIPEEALTIYIQLGAGKINAIENNINFIIETIQKKYDVYVVVGESIIGKTLRIKGNHVTIIRDYPNAKYFKGFDIAISASGYNTFHELIYFGIPSIFVPNQETHKDSQLSRAEGAAKLEAAKVIYDCTEEQIQETFEFVINNLASIRDKASKLISCNGAKEVALKIINYIS